MRGIHCVNKKNNMQMILTIYNCMLRPYQATVLKEITNQTHPGAIQPHAIHNLCLLSNQHATHTCYSISSVVSCHLSPASCRATCIDLSTHDLSNRHRNIYQVYGLLFFTALLLLFFVLKSKSTVPSFKDLFNL